MKPIQTKSDVAGKAESVEIKELRSAKRRFEMKTNSKLSLVFASVAMSVLLVNCSGDYSPVSPSPVVSDIDVNPVGEMEAHPLVIDIPTPTLPTVGDNDFIARESFNYHLSGWAHSRLRLEGVNGRVRIEGSYDSASVLVAGERIVKSDSDEDARRHLEYLEVRIEELGDELAVRTIQPENSSGRNYQVNYTISLPGSWSVEVSELNGNVILSDIHGSARVDLMNGAIEADLVLPMDGEIDLQTVNGEIDLDIPARTSAQFSADIVNGSINVSGLTLRNEVKTRNSLQGTLGEGRGQVSLRTTNGRINVKGF
jgi:hypothetical protein